MKHKLFILLCILAVPLFSNARFYKQIDATKANDTAYAVIKIDKSFLYTNPLESNKTPAYLIKGDKIEILQKQDGWCKIKYTTSISGRFIVRWIRVDAMK